MHELNIEIAAGEIFGQIAVVAKNISIFPFKHPMVLESAMEAVTLLKLVWGDSVQVTFHIINSELYFEKHLLPEATLKHAAFINHLSSRGFTNISLKREISPENLAHFFAVINADRNQVLNESNVKKRLKEEGVAGIEFNSLLPINMIGNMYNLVTKESASPAAHSYQGAVSCLESLGDEMTTSPPAIDTMGLQNSVSDLVENFLDDRSATLGVMSIKNYDRYLFHHSVNVAVTSLLIARKLSFNEQQMRAVGLSGLLHDLGKLQVPRDIISKSERLSEAEWSIMRSHPIQGAKMLMKHENLGELPILAALEHHVGYDLSGYPTLKNIARPHIIARIVGLADVYEAITANRSYRPAQSVGTAIKALLNGSGGQFDPLLVKLLLSITGVFPPGSQVKLKNGAVAVVVEPNEDQPFFPKVRLMEDALSSDPELVINTAQDPTNHAIVGIAESEEV